MKNLPWILFCLSLLIMLIGVISKVSGAFFFHFAPVTWWRAAMALAVYTLVLAKLTEKKA